METYKFKKLRNVGYKFSFEELMKSASESFAYSLILYMVLSFTVFSKTTDQEQIDKSMDQIRDSWNTHMMQPKWRWFK